jgi:hypothetical protein
MEKYNNEPVEIVLRRGGKREKDGGGEYNQATL